MMRASTSGFPLRPLVIAALLTIILVPNPSSAGDGFLWNDSDGRLLSEGESGSPGRRGNWRNGSNFLFPKGSNSRFLSIQIGERHMGGDDFEGTTFYTSDTELFMIPKMDPATFLGLYMEFRDGIMGGGIGYSRAAHDYSWSGLDFAPAQATSHFVDFDFRIHALPDRVVQPFGLLGFSFNGIRVEDGKYNAVNDTFSDLSMWGLGLNWGAGVDYYPPGAFKLTVGARWHANSYNSISGEDLDDGLICTGVNYYLSVGFNIDS